ncbi:hypothetical protein [Halococcus salifodinae]|uniref:Uncharacterized protein n=1 Tax=Halococcus salifodinae DSM 8989 TaxID=1227456 RepID=M0NBT6_9EURY|nr:hypothetical protein [Halococcus salifodinae]EMA54544.1 hypothetical protein C450_05795 [Halococcus salifodinae DSM 8989]
MEDKHTKTGVGRRTFLAGTSSLAALPFIPVGVSSAKPTGNLTVLGDFESGLDGWKTNGGNELARFSTEEFPAAVIHETHALRVGIDGDPFPMIENKKRVKQADFADSPYLSAAVSPTITDSDSDVVCKFRYHHNDAPPDSDKTANAGKGRQKKPVLVEESPEITVPQMVPTRLYWDMSGLPEDELSSPKRLELVWYPADHPPAGGPRGRGPSGPFKYEGSMLIDDIRLSDSAADLAADAIPTKMQTYQLEHGVLTETVANEYEDGLEEGDLTFLDGTNIPYTFEITDDEKRFTIDDETFVVGGGV